MSHKREADRQYVIAVTEAIKQHTTMRKLYVSIHGSEPDTNELQRFSNRLNPTRSNPSADMLGLCVANIPELHEMTLREFFGIDADPN